LLGDELVGVASYESATGPPAAEIALAVADGMHGRGIATLLLEHLVWLARARGVQVFTGPALAANSAVLRVVGDAGLAVRRRWDNGVVELSMLIPQSAALSEVGVYLDAVAGREKHADVASLESLLAPRSVAVVGAGHRPGSIGRMILLNIRDAGFAGALYAVNPHGREIVGIPCVPSVTALPEAPDLVVVAVPAAGVLDVVQECGMRGAGSLVVLTSGLTPAQESSLLEASRRGGMRLIGPDCFGVAVPGNRTGRHVRSASPLRRQDRPGRAIRRGRRGAAGALLPPGNRDFLLRFGGRHAGCLRQRHVDVVGGGQHHRACRALPGILRQPAHVLPELRAG